MTRWTTHFTAATAALILSLVTITTVVSVPPAQAAGPLATIELA